MKRLASILGVVVLALAAFVWTGGHEHSIAQESWPPLISCSDVTGDGDVSGLDVFEILGSFNATYPDSNYTLLKDVDGGGSISATDFFKALSDFNLTCPEIDTQVVQATLAVEKYRDQSVALADGYVPTTQNLHGHGVHWMKLSLLDGVFDITQPEGLNYSVDGELLAVFYIDPLWLPGHETPPAGFVGDEDMWHDHPGLCQWQGPSGPMVAEGVAQADCVARPGGIWFQSFGWMVHLWNYLPNAMGRFMMHNDSAG